MYIHTFGTTKYRRYNALCLFLSNGKGASMCIRSMQFVTDIRIFLSLTFNYFAGREEAERRNEIEICRDVARLIKLRHLNSACIFRTDASCMKIAYDKNVK